MLGLQAGAFFYFFFYLLPIGDSDSVFHDGWGLVWGDYYAEEFSFFVGLVVFFCVSDSYADVFEIVPELVDLFFLVVIRRPWLLFMVPSQQRAGWKFA